MLKKKEAERLKSLTIAEAAEEFGLSYRSIMPFVDLALRHGNLNLPMRERNLQHSKTARFREEKRWCFECASRITLRDIIRELDELHLKGGPHRVEAYRACVNFLVDIGFTHLDSVALPRRTAPFGYLKLLPRKQLLAQNASVLNTLSPQMLRLLRNGKRFTIADILGMESEDLKRRGKGAAKTYLMLRHLGFGPRDGAFMRKNPLKEYAEKLLEEDPELEFRDAMKIAVVAAEKNWI